MIPVCNQQDLNSLLAESIERDGELLMNMLQSIGTKSGDPVEFSIQGDNVEILGSFDFIIPEKSPINDTVQPKIDLENTVTEFLNLAEEKYALLSALPKSEPSTDGTTETLYRITVKIGSVQFGKSLIEYPRLQIVFIKKRCEPCPDGKRPVCFS